MSEKPEMEKPKVEAEPQQESYERLSAEDLLAEIKQKAREGSVPPAEPEIPEIDEENIDWERLAEEAEAEPEIEAPDPKETAKLLVELADGLNVSLCLLVSGLGDRASAEKLFALTSREKKRLYKAAYPVIKKHGVGFPAELMLVLVAAEIFLPRLAQAKTIRESVAKPEAEPEAKTEAEGNLYTDIFGE